MWNEKAEFATGTELNTNIHLFTIASAALQNRNLFTFHLYPRLCRNVANLKINLLEDGKSKNAIMCTRDTVVFQYGIKYDHICNICVSIGAVGNFSVHVLSLVCYLNQLNEEQKKKTKMPWKLLRNENAQISEYTTTTVECCCVAMFGHLFWQILSSTVAYVCVCVSRAMKP